MARYIDMDEIKFMGGVFDDRNNEIYIKMSDVKQSIEQTPTADVEEVKHGEWELEIKSYYEDNWDESLRLCVYILAKCPFCGESHNPKQVFSETYCPPEDAPEDFRFNNAYMKRKALGKFKQKGYKFQNYCPHCGAKMDGGKEE